MKVNQKISDRVILILLSGSVSAAIANAFGYLSRLIYKPTVVMPEAAAQLFVNSSQAHTVLGFIFGNMMSFVVGGFHALMFVYILDFTGWRFLWWKSLAVTTGGWLVGVGMLFRALGVGKSDLYSAVLFYGAHLVYLTVSAIIVGEFGVPKEYSEK